MKGNKTTKKPKLALGFTFVADRYDDDTKKAETAPLAFNDAKPEK